MENVTCFHWDCDCDGKRYLLSESNLHSLFLWPQNCTYLLTIDPEIESKEKPSHKKWSRPTIILAWQFSQFIFDACRRDLIWRRRKYLSGVDRWPTLQISIRLAASSISSLRDSDLAPGCSVLGWPDDLDDWWNLWVWIKTNWVCDNVGEKKHLNTELSKINK